MKKLFFAVLIMGAVFSAGVFGQQKYALIIGNAAYTNVTPLRNPVNDAVDMKEVLEGLGFQVELITNGTYGQMEDAVVRLQRNLSGASGSYGMFFYAGHGVQSNGENYLVPVDAAINSEAQLKHKAVALQYVLDELQGAGNELNMVVLDACRDNPFSWARGGRRGLQVVGTQPAGSIIVYATGAGKTAADGEGRNGLFTGQLLRNLQTPGLSVRDMFDRTGADVQRVSNNQQTPAVYSQFFRTAYLNGSPQEAPQPVPEGLEWKVEHDAVTITKYRGTAAAVVIPASIEGKRVTAIGEYAFASCSSLSSVTIPNSVTSTGDSAFWGCGNLSSVTIPNSVTSIGILAFAYCHSLSSVTIPNSVTSIGAFAFIGCSSLSSVTIPNSVTSIGKAPFAECDSLSNINVDPQSRSFLSRDGALFDKNAATLICYPAGKTTTAYNIPTSVTSIGERTFAGCSSLSSVTIPNSVTSIGAFAFIGCSSLSSVTISNSVTSIGQGAFAGCSSLSSVTIPNSVTSIGDYAFSGCSSLSSVTIPNNVTSIGLGAFEGCRRLSSVTIPNSVTSIGDAAFAGCNSLPPRTVAALASRFGAGVFGDDE